MAWPCLRLARSKIHLICVMCTWVSGETDFLKPHGTKLLESFVDPVVIHHPKGHTIPRLDEKTTETMLHFIDKIQKLASTEAPVKTRWLARIPLRLRLGLKFVVHSDGLQRWHGHAHSSEPTVPISSFRAFVFEKNVAHVLNEPALGVAGDEMGKRCLASFLHMKALDLIVYPKVLLTVQTGVAFSFFFELEREGWGRLDTKEGRSNFLTISEAKRS
ncbi:hypothetical protein ACLOJK_013532 [Asimina triloba]